jgi:hypothetical protein
MCGEIEAVAFMADMPKKTDDELVRHIREQMGFLRSSSESFDAGRSSEALRLAVSLRVLLHDTPRSSSLLNQMGVKLDLAFMDTVTMPIRDESGSIFVGAVLAPIRIENEGGGHVPQATTETRFTEKPFHEWWTTRVIGTWEGTFTRKDTVLALANVDGGAHVDPKMSKKYAALRRYGLGWNLIDGAGNSVDAGNPALATVRQIAHEVESTIRAQLADILA